MKTKQQVDALLEQYVFAVADKFISSATLQEQDKIIDLLLQINKPESASTLLTQHQAQAMQVERE
jgi:hypothetical protein